MPFSLSHTNDDTTLTILHKTGEHFFYNLQVTTVESDVLETIRLESPIRQITKHIITIENPLKGKYSVVMFLF